MKRLLATLRTDVRLQFRNGFYYATAFVVALWVLLFSQLHVGPGGLDVGWLLPTQPPPQSHVVSVCPSSGCQ